jgi:hypothetical protein
MQWTGSAWASYLSSAVGSEHVAGAAGSSTLAILKATQAASDVVIANGWGEDRGAWVAQRSFYHLRHLSPSGKVTTTISRGRLEVTLRDRTPAELASIEQAAGKRFTGGNAQVAQRSILGVAAGPDGLYVLVEPEGKSMLAVDRYDATTESVERATTTIPVGVPVASFVAGDDGLYVAQPKIQQGAWFLSWEELARADWEKLRDVVIR